MVPWDSVKHRFYCITCAYHEVLLNKQGSAPLFIEAENSTNITFKIGVMYDDYQLLKSKLLRLECVCHVMCVLKTLFLSSWY
jgi:hypothetical protein